MIMLEFVNSDARPKKTTIHCDCRSVSPIMAWYGAYYAGDRYSVYVGGEKVRKDRNGELVAFQPPEDAR